MAYKRSLRYFGYVLDEMVGGLEIVMDPPMIDRGAIEYAIRRFRELGETEWQDSVLIRRNLLPDQTYAEALAAWQNGSAKAK